MKVRRIIRLAEADFPGLNLKSTSTHKILLTSLILAVKIVGPVYANKIKDLAIMLYLTAHAYALRHGIIIADTKFEFGIDPADPSSPVYLLAEVLTPDSSRFWPADQHQQGSGRVPESFDKQFLRNWLVNEGLKGVKGVEVPDAV